MFVIHVVHCWGDFFLFYLCVSLDCHTCVLFALFLIFFISVYLLIFIHVFFLLFLISVYLLIFIHVFFFIFFYLCVSLDCHTFYFISYFYYLCVSLVCHLCVAFFFYLCVYLVCHTFFYLCISCLLYMCSLLEKVVVTDKVFFSDD